MIGLCQDHYTEEAEVLKAAGKEIPAWFPVVDKKDCSKCQRESSVILKRIEDKIDAIMKILVGSKRE